MSNNESVEIKTSDPTPLGLFGLALVTLVASSVKLGWTQGTSYVIPWVIFLGASAQLVACIQDFKKCNLFGSTAFGAYAFFWYGVGMTWMIGHGVFGESLAEAVDPRQIGFAYLGYLIFSVYMTICTLTKNKVLFLILVFIDLLFIGLIIDTFFHNSAAHAIAGWSELIISLLSFYGSGALLINDSFSRQILPLGRALVSKT